jgi:hypothetical protein
VVEAGAVVAARAVVAVVEADRDVGDVETPTPG